jgi:simple sugar transport system ATP-binding protein/ribose transport system ATP-binding protein
LSSAAFLEARGLTKRFGATEALSNIGLDVARGTIHGLVGENGAGKSTLGKIVAGLFPPTSGELRVDGRPVRYRTPRDALADGITIVQQELTLVPRRSVLENVFLGKEPSRAGIADRRRMRAKYEEIAERSGLRVPPDALAQSLSIADKKRVEILKALARDARLVVMDEPTAMLTLQDAQMLHEIVRRLKEAGATIIYVSHYLHEVLDLADIVTVLRNGQVVETVSSSAVTPDDLVTAMLGRPLSLTFPTKRHADPDARPVLDVRDLSRRGVIERISFTVRSGEIVGLAGLVGSGRSEVARAIFGVDPRDAGEVWIDGARLDHRSPAAAIKAGLALLPENRKEQGLLMSLSAAENVTLPHLPGLSKRGFLNKRKERRLAGDLLRRVDVRPPDPGVRVQSLSGGNQQKVLFAKWLLREPKIFIADEPTQGIDVGAKRAIYELIATLAQHGMAVLLISSELEEILGLAHRVIVMRRGKIVGEFEGEAMTEEAIMRTAFATA